jgi:hypothetical protein
LFERALARDEQFGLLGEWSEDINCLLTTHPAHFIPVIIILFNLNKVQHPFIDGPLIPLSFYLFARSNKDSHRSNFDLGSPNPANKGDQNNNNK